MLRAALAALGTLALAVPAQAGEVVSLDPVVVRAKRPRFSPQPQQVTVLDASEIARTGSGDLGALLGREGFAVRTYGPTGFLSSVTMRGALGEGVLVLRDGIRLNSAERGGVDLSTVSLLGVERVEVLSGGASGLFGADAVGGVINLITSDKTTSRLATGIGSYGDGFLEFETGGEFGALSWSSGIKRHIANNDYPYFYRDEVANRVNSQFAGTEFNLGLKQRWDYDSLAGALQVNWQDKGVPGAVNYPSPHATQSDHNVLGRLSYQRQWDDQLRQDTSLTYRLGQLGFHNPDAPPSFSSDSTLNGADLQSQFIWTPESHQLQAGLGLTHDGVDSTALGVHSRDVLAVFGHDTWYLPFDINAFGDLRLDRHPGFGWHLSPRAGVSWLALPALRLRGAVGNAYRAPTFNDLYWPTDASAAGNPDLQPETTLTGELGADWLLGAAFELNATAFAHRGHGTIQWQPGAGGRWSPLNLGETQITGVEGRTTWRPWEFLELSGTATWLSAIDLSTTGAAAGKNLIYRPGLVSSLAATVRPYTGLSAKVGWDYTGERFTTSQNTDRLPAYDLWSARLAYAWADGDEVFGAGENLLNAYYQSQPYYPMPGRTLRAGWSHAF